MRISPFLLRKILNGATLAVFLAFVGFLACLYVRFYGLLIGEVQLAETPPLLGEIQTKRFDDALDRFERRKSAASGIHALRNPFSSRGR